MKLYYTYSDLATDLSDICRQAMLNNFKPDVIIGPGRGGYIPGVMLSHYYNAPFEGFVWQLRDGDVQDEQSLVKIINRYRSGKILLIDDINDTGATLESVVNTINQEAFIGNLHTAVLFNKQASSFKDIDYFAREITLDENPWIVFPYEEWWK